MDTLVDLNISLNEEDCIDMTLKQEKHSLFSHRGADGKREKEREMWTGDCVRYSVQRRLGLKCLNHFCLNLTLIFLPRTSETHKSYSIITDSGIDSQQQLDQELEQ